MENSVFLKTTCVVNKTARLDYLNIMASTTSAAPPIFLFLQSNQCGHCHTFVQKYWKNFQKGLKELRPDIRIEHVIFKSFDPNSYDQTKYPKGLAFWGFFYPAFLLIPGDLWDRAMKDSTVTLTIDDGAEGMNLVFRNNELAAVRGYNYDDKGVLAWATKTLAQAKYNSGNKDAPAKGLSAGKASSGKATTYTGKPNTSAQDDAEMIVASSSKFTVSSDLIVESKKLPSQSHVNLNHATAPATKPAPKSVLQPTPSTAYHSQTAVPAPTTTLIHTPKSASSTSTTPTSGYGKAKDEQIGINVCSIRMVSRPANR